MGKDSGSPQEVVTPIALETYSQHFKKLARTHVESWHLCQIAEDRCRAEHMPRLRPEMLRKTGVEPSWSDVFIAAAMDKRYWDEEVRDPSILFLARHGRKRAQDEPQAPDPKASRVSDSPAAGAGKGKGKGKKGKGKGHGGAPRQRDEEGLFVTDDDGRQVCFNYAQKTCRKRCPFNRAHKCQHCLGSHPNRDCKADQ